MDLAGLCGICIDNLINLSWSDINSTFCLGEVKMNHTTILYLTLLQSVAVTGLIAASLIAFTGRPFWNSYAIYMYSFCLFLWHNHLHNKYSERGNEKQHGQFG